MRRKHDRILLRLVALAVMMSLAAFAPSQVRAQSTGTVCLSSASSGTCPSSAPTLSATVGSSFTVAVNVQGSESFNGFDIRVQADPTIINASSISIAGSVITTPLVDNQCLNGFFMAGSCQPSPGIVDVVLVQMASTPNPTNGRLFSITYQVVGSSSGTLITYPTGCTSSSVSGTTTCVSVSNAGIAVPETVQGATFTSGAPPPDFTISASPTSLTIQQGSCAASSISVTSVGGFNGTVNLQSSVSPSGPVSSPSPMTVSVPSGGTATSTLSVCTTGSTSPGSYTDSVTGTSGPASHSVIVSINVPTPDFTITANPSSQSISRGSTIAFTITVTGNNGFNMTVNLVAAVSPSVRHGPIATIPGKVGPYSSSTLTVSTARNTPIGTYTVTVTATSGNLTHTVSVTVTVTR